MNTKLLLAISCIILHSSLTAQQIKLAGQVSLHNSKYNTGEIEYIDNVEITAAFTTPAVSDVEGKFELEFVDIDEGTSLDIKADKAGLEIVNGADLRDVVLGRLLPLKIYLAPKGAIVKAQTEIYNISIKTLTAQHEKLIAQLEEKNEQSDSLINDLEHKLNRTIANRFEAEQLLTEQLYKTKRRLPEFAKKLASVNLDFASEMYRKAYDYVKEGEIEKAIETLDEEILDKDAEDAVTQIDGMKNNIEIVDSTISIEYERFDSNIKSLFLEADAYEKQLEYNKNNWNTIGL